MNRVFTRALFLISTSITLGMTLWWSEPSAQATIVYVTNLNHHEEYTLRLGVAELNDAEEPTAADLWTTAFQLQKEIHHWGAGTVFLAFGPDDESSKFRTLLAKDSAGRIYVFPDNGLITFVDSVSPLQEVRILNESKWNSHGRDLALNVSALLDSKKLTLEQLGDVIPSTQIIKLPFKVKGITCDVALN